MTTEAIYQKYATEIAKVTGDGSWIDWGVMRLALRLAIADAHGAGMETPSDSQDGALQNALDQIDALRKERNAQPDQRMHEHLQSQINRLNEWLAEHEPGLYISPGDTADAVSKVLELQRQQLTDLRGSISTINSQRENALQFANSEIDGLRQQLAQMDADNSDLRNRVQQAQQEIDRLTRENGIAVATFNSLREPTPATNGNGAAELADAPTWWAYLDAETNDWRISLEAKRRRFGEIPKAQRLLLAQAFARHIGDGETPTQAAFNANKPEWMPMANGIVQGVGIPWSDLLTAMLHQVAP